MSRTVRPGPGTSGFTLLELLISLILFSLLGLMSYGLLSLCLKGTSQGEAALLNLQQLQVAQHYIQRSLSSALPRMRGEGRWPFFVGESQEVEFLTPVPLRAHQLGGIYHLRLALVRDEQGHDSLAAEEIQGPLWLQDPTKIETRVFLLRDLSFLRFTYLAGGEEYDTWHADDQESLPDKVRVSLGLPGQQPQEWLIPLRVIREPEDG